MKKPAASQAPPARRAIDIIREEEEVDAAAFKALIRAAVDLNTSSGKAKTKRGK